MKKNFRVHNQLFYSIFRGLADMNGDGQMDLNEFSVACKLITNQLKGFPLPQTLPPQMKAMGAQAGGAAVPGMPPMAAAPMPGMQPGAMPGMLRVTD